MEAGHTLPKPLIEADGRPLIEHVVGLFPGESNFSFICNSSHLDEFPLRPTLERIAPGSGIFQIPPHKKGPVFAVSSIFDSIDDRDEVIVNYCDFSKRWDYGRFLSEVREKRADGAISAYRGFHPHMLGTTNYAFIREVDSWLEEIREKQPFTSDRTKEFASDGTYYFRTGAILKEYFAELMRRDIHVGGEYYVSMVYNLMRESGLRTWIHEIDQMLQWGTPRDLEEYQSWSDYFRRSSGPRTGPTVRPNSVTLIPLSGKGRRFADEGYAVPKPLIEVSGEPMVLQAAAHLPSSARQTFVCLAEHLNSSDLRAKLLSRYPTAKVVGLEAVTAGQACSCEAGLLDEDPNAELLIGACDNGMVWDAERYGRLLDEGVDAVVWSFRHHPSVEAHPEMYGWLDVAEDGTVRRASVKVPISDDPYNDHAIVGTFFFRRVRHFKEALRRLYGQGARVNGEYYVDSCVNELIAMGLKVKAFEVDNYVCWGTPNDLRTYEYWQRFFGRCGRHEYHPAGAECIRS